MNDTIKQWQAAIALINELEEHNMKTSQNEKLDAVRNRSFIVGSIDKFGTFSASDNPKMHATEMSARTEATRLAIETPGKAYIILKLCGAEMIPSNRVSI